MFFLFLTECEAWFRYKKFASTLCYCEVASVISGTRDYKTDININFYGFGLK